MISTWMKKQRSNRFLANYMTPNNTLFLLPQGIVKGKTIKSKTVKSTQSVTVDNINGTKLTIDNAMSFQTLK